MFQGLASCSKGQPCQFEENPVHLNSFKSSLHFLDCMQIFLRLLNLVVIDQLYYIEALDAILRNKPQSLYFQTALKDFPPMVHIKLSTSIISDVLIA